MYLIHSYPVILSCVCSARGSIGLDSMLLGPMVLASLHSGPTFRIASRWRADRLHMCSQVTPGGPTVRGDESLMAPKQYGSSAVPVQKSLRWGVDPELAGAIGCFNRNGAEPNLYFTEQLEFTQSLGWMRGVEPQNVEPTTFYDSASGKPLFVAPVDRTMDEFLSESLRHGWPSFRQAEVVWENVRVLDGLEGARSGRRKPCPPSRPPMSPRGP